MIYEKKGIRILKSYFLSLKSSQGFSLIELIVVLAIIAILFTGMTVLFNPLAQLEKAHNATRQHDLNQIKQALDSYFNDKGCYPLSLPFGSQWSSGTTVYMQKVPQDPDCSSNKPTNCYDYQTNGSSCPQWNVLFATMQNPINATIPACILSTTASCTPTNGLGTYNYCAVSGKLDCSYLSGTTLPTPVVTGSGGGGGGSNPTSIPLPSVDCAGQLSTCSNKICNVEAASQCAQCGGTMVCYPDLRCGGVDCTKQ